MDVEIHGEGAFSSALVRLAPGEAFVSESGAMVRASTNIDVDVTTRSRGQGGILAGVKRLLAGESFFLSTYRVTDGRPGEVGLAPVLQGEVRRLALDGSSAWLCAGSSYVGSEAGLELDTQFQGLKGLFSGEGLFFMRVSGAGELLVSAFGRLDEVQVDGELVVDSGHVAAFEEGLEYSLGKAGSSWLQSFLGGEGVVLRFRGRGRLLLQSHNRSEFGRTLGGRLPPRES